MTFIYRLFHEENFQRTSFCLCICCYADSQFGGNCIYFLNRTERIAIIKTHEWINSVALFTDEQENLAIETAVEDRIILI
jgi:hypothetical protein